MWTNSDSGHATEDDGSGPKPVVVRAHSSRTDKMATEEVSKGIKTGNPYILPEERTTGAVTAQTYR